jgi:hypothetical protein
MCHLCDARNQSSKGIESSDSQAEQSRSQPKFIIIEDEYMPKPHIVIKQDQHVTVAPVESITDVMTLVEKLGKANQEKGVVTLARLTTATGDLAASLVQNDEDLALEVADVIIAALLAADSQGYTAHHITAALNKRFADQFDGAVALTINQALTNAGFKQAA